jgi:hypothetical protein
MATRMHLQFTIDGHWRGQAPREHLWPEVERVLRLMLPWVHDATLVRITRTDGLADDHAPSDYQITTRDGKTFCVTVV